MLAFLPTDIMAIWLLSGQPHLRPCHN